jgi:DNA invertase Pin-like site-specific DNA recombinase
MKAVAYYRVSTAGQGRSGLGLEAQRTSVLGLAASREYNLLAEFTEVESGKRDNRPELEKALNLAKVTGSVLVIAKLDRLSRNAAFLLTLRDSGVRFIAADIPDANDLTIGVLAIVAQAERESISERTKAALGSIKARIKADGYYVTMRTGRRITRLGNPNGAAPLKRAINREASSLAARRAIALRRANDLRSLIKRLQNEGFGTPYALAQELERQGVLSARGGRWKTSTVRNLLALLRKTEGAGM